MKLRLKLICKCDANVYFSILNVERFICFECRKMRYSPRFNPQRYRLADNHQLILNYEIKTINVL